MSERGKEFKRPPKKYQPKGLAILYEDRDILVVDKVSGLLTVGNERERERTADSYLTDYVRKGNPKSRNRVIVVHRLDRETSGVIIFAKDERAKRHLVDHWSAFQLTYWAVVNGAMPEPKGIITSHLVENGIHKMFSANHPGKGKLAKTGYRVVKEGAKYSLLEIDLLTSRKHQIRVHLSDKGCPIVGDKKYGKEGEKGIKRLALHAASMTITHPYSKEKMTFRSEMPMYFEMLMKGKAA